MNYVMLKDVCLINMGQSPDSDSYNENGEGVPFFQGNAEFGERYPVTRKWCTVPTKMAEPEDILISVRAPIGAMNYAKEECCIGRGLAALTPDKTKVSPEFIFWLLKGKNEELNSKGTGSTFNAIGKKVLEETLVPDIGLETQIEYSEILEKVYSIIRRRKQELQKLDELIKARFVELFGDYRTNDKGFEIHKGSELFKFSSGKFLPEENRHDEGVPVYGGNGIAWYTDSSLIDYPTVIIGRVGAWCGNVHMVTEPVWITDNAIYIKEQKTKKYTLEFLTELMKVMDFHQYADFSGQPKITQKPLETLGYLTPPVEMQNEFTDFVHQVDKSKFIRNQVITIKNIND